MYIHRFLNVIKGPIFPEKYYSRVQKSIFGRQARQKSVRKVIQSFVVN
jgi:hypothetical protein